MNIEQLLHKRDKYLKNKALLSVAAVKNYEQNFDVTYTHQSTAIEGNTLSLVETKLLIEDGYSIGGKPLREIYEVVNHNKAYQFIKIAIAEGNAIDENMVKDIHQILMDNIIQGGVYRSVDVYISGAQHTPPTPNEMFSQVKAFYADLLLKAKELNPIEMAAWTHAEFVKIHPFVDGNGRASRLLMNYQLLLAGFLPVSIAPESRLEYFNALEAYAISSNLEPFADMIAELEEKELDWYLRAIQQTKDAKNKEQER